MKNRECQIKYRVHYSKCPIEWAAISDWPEYSTMVLATSVNEAVEKFNRTNDRRLGTRLILDCYPQEPAGCPQISTGPMLTEAEERRQISVFMKEGRAYLERRLSAIRAYMEGPEYRRLTEGYQNALCNTEFILTRAYQNIV